MGIALLCRSSDIFLSHRENRLDFNSRPTLCRRFLKGRPIRPTAKEPQADPDRVRDQKPLPGTDTDREPEIPVGSGPGRSAGPTDCQLWSISSETGITVLVCLEGL